MRMQLLVAEQERLRDMKQECAKLEPTKKRYGVHPTVLFDAIKEFGEKLEKIDGTIADLMSELNTPSDQHSDCFQVVRNVPRNPHTVVIDFDGKDDDGNPTCEAQFKDAIFREPDNRAMIGAVAQGMGGCGQVMCVASCRCVERGRDLVPRWDTVHDDRCPGRPVSTRDEYRRYR